MFDALSNEGGLADLPSARFGREWNRRCGVYRDVKAVHKMSVEVQT